MTKETLNYRSAGATRQAPHPSDYRPYDAMPAFAEGYRAWLAAARGLRTTPADRTGVEAQAWDRGYEYGMRLHRHTSR